MLFKFYEETKRKHRNMFTWFHKHGFSCICMFSYFKNNWEDQTTTTLLFRENRMGFERQQKSQKYCGSRLVLTWTLSKLVSLFISALFEKTGCVVKFHFLVVTDFLVSPTKCLGPLFNKHDFVREKKNYFIPL